GSTKSGRPTGRPSRVGERVCRRPGPGAALQHRRGAEECRPFESALLRAAYRARVARPRSTTMNAPEKLPAAPEPHVMKTYGRLPVALSYGRGCWLWDTEGRKYLDALAGIVVNT